MLAQCGQGLGFNPLQDEGAGTTSWSNEKLSIPPTGGEAFKFPLPEAPPPRALP